MTGMAPDIQLAAGNLRQAAQKGDFAGAELAARQFTRAVEAALPALPREAAIGCLRDACALIEWARRMLCVSRARVGDELRRVRRLAAYHQAFRPPPVHTWKILG